MTMSTTLQPRMWQRWDVPGMGNWLPVFLGITAMYVPTIVDLARGLWREDAYAHGPIILAATAWMIWRRRGVLAGAEPTLGASIAGCLTLLFGLFLYAIGRSLGIAQLDVGSMIPVLAGTLMLLRGWRAVAGLWFPLVFLLFAVPLPGFVIESATAPLKSLVSQVVEGTLYLFGYPVARSGVVLNIGQYQLLMADACSGLNSLYSLAALVFMYLYLTLPHRLTRTVALIASIVPIALVTNIIRVMVLLLITYYLGESAGQGFLHMFAGALLFATALLLLLGTDMLLRRLPGFGQRGAAT